MINLFRYIKRPDLQELPISYVDGVPMITAEDWHVIMLHMDGIYPDGYARGYLYDIAAGELEESIYERTNGSKVLLFRYSDASGYGEFVWSDRNKAYYSSQDGRRL